ncbi:hypothetical protein A2U01_0017393 [Trifolium medium]|uniref:Uncharacterized protein n=1 Tax=Trifolium medium TaxID=97028 RepID=A0A392N9B0_9FABA|nr:hypothetical protein [Trifolium medium]
MGAEECTEQIAVQWK